MNISTLLKSVKYSTSDEHGIALDLDEKTGVENVT